ncbi:hypothetical protein [Tessaracoccus aquimaris]|uniref:hypothetical protein n=1 Tax=Tessaracoccus aquimaris TaxID=1332264 RepID=UPI000988E104|nr:hypothetical protein [Tessaracoccus aquimaris]
MSEARGGWSPALLAAARIAVGAATAPPSAPAWTDARGTLTRAGLARRVRATARALPPGPVVVCSEDQRAVAVESLAGLLARRSVRIVPPSAGATALESARRSRAGRGVSFFTSGSTGDPTLRHTRRGPSPRPNWSRLWGCCRCPAIRASGASPPSTTATAGALCC